MRYIVNEDIAPQSLSLGHGCMGAITVKNLRKKREKERLQFEVCTVSRFYVREMPFTDFVYRESSIALKPLFPR